jgi:hypothetical protein
MARYIGQTVTIFTKSGGLSGNGFTGVLAGIHDGCVKLITDIGAPPACPIGSSCCGGFPHFGGGYGGFGGYDGYDGGYDGGSYGGGKCKCGGACGGHCSCKGKKDGHGYGMGYGMGRGRYGMGGMGWNWLGSLSYQKS